MRYTQIFAPTLKEAPAEAELVSHKLLLRAGMIRKVAAGIYEFLPLGLKALRKVEQIVREEMDRAGGQEVLMPSMVPAELWKESGRWEKYGKELLRIKDRHEREFCYGPTHEEVITDLVRGEIRSYKDLPKTLYQIQTKFRDEIRPRFGLMRGREFLMKDGYSFHASQESLDETYNRMREAYLRTFERCGLEARAVEADTGAIGGSDSEEFMVLAESGEDAIAACTSCKYAANVEKAETKVPQGEPSAPPSGSLKEVATPGLRAVEEVSPKIGVPPERMIKTLIYETDMGPVVALVRGTDQLNEIKLKNACGAAHLQLAGEATVQKITGAPVGFAGPVKLKEDVPVYADLHVKHIRDGATGANKADAHLVNVEPGRDFKPTAWKDLRLVQKDDPCPRCSGGKLTIARGIEVGHIFKLGTRYSGAMKAVFLDAAGKEQPIIMGTYGIGVSRTLAAAIEQHHDKDGIKFPLPIAPVPVALLALNADNAEVTQASDAIYKALLDAGIGVLYDDRDERAGGKFKDADLIGLPLRVAVGTKGLKDGKVELKFRADGRVETLPPGEVPARIAAIVNGR
ncbi:MAG: proline--tRNA ligase [Bdellovibrionota bacterium]